MNATSSLPQQLLHRLHLPLQPHFTCQHLGERNLELLMLARFVLVKRNYLLLHFLQFLVKLSHLALMGLF